VKATALLSLAYALGSAGFAFAYFADGRPIPGVAWAVSTLAWAVTASLQWRLHIRQRKQFEAARAHVEDVFRRMDRDMDENLKLLGLSRSEDRLRGPVEWKS
jgi:hypothetical protein